MNAALIAAAVVVGGFLVLRQKQATRDALDALEDVLLEGPEDPRLRIDPLPGPVPPIPRGARAARAAPPAPAVPAFGFGEQGSSFASTSRLRR